MTCNPDQAEAIAQAVLQPDLDAQAALRQRRASEALQVTRQRRAGALALLGMAIGGTAGQLMYGAFPQGVLVGGALGYLVARLGRRPGR